MAEQPAIKLTRNKNKFGSPESKKDVNIETNITQSAIIENTPKNKNQESNISSVKKSLSGRVIRKRPLLLEEQKKINTSDVETNKLKSAAETKTVETDKETSDAKVKPKLNESVKIDNAKSTVIKDNQSVITKETVTVKKVLDKKNANVKDDKAKTNEIENTKTVESGNKKGELKDDKAKPNNETIKSGDKSSVQKYKKINLDDLNHIEKGSDRKKINLDDLNDNKKRLVSKKINLDDLNQSEKDVVDIDLNNMDFSIIDEVDDNSDNGHGDPMDNEYDKLIYEEYDELTSENEIFNRKNNNFQESNKTINIETLLEDLPLIEGKHSMTYGLKTERTSFYLNDQRCFLCDTKELRDEEIVHHFQTRKHALRSLEVIDRKLYNLYKLDTRVSTAELCKIAMDLRSKKLRQESYKDCVNYIMTNLLMNYRNESYGNNFSRVNIVSNMSFYYTANEKEFKNNVYFFSEPNLTLPMLKDFIHGLPSRNISNALWIIFVGIEAVFSVQHHTFEKCDKDLREISFNSFFGNAQASNDERTDEVLFHFSSVQKEVQNILGKGSHIILLPFIPISLKKNQQSIESSSVEFSVISEDTELPYLYNTLAKKFIKKLPSVNEKVFQKIISKLCDFFTKHNCLTEDDASYHSTIPYFKQCLPIWSKIRLDTKVIDSQSGDKLKFSCVVFIGPKCFAKTMPKDSRYHFVEEDGPIRMSSIDVINKLKGKNDRILIVLVIDATSLYRKEVQQNCSEGCEYKVDCYIDDFECRRENEIECIKNIEKIKRKCLSMSPNINVLITTLFPRKVEYIKTFHHNSHEKISDDSLIFKVTKSDFEDSVEKFQDAYFFGFFHITKGNTPKLAQPAILDGTKDYYTECINQWKKLFYYTLGVYNEAGKLKLCNLNRNMFNDVNKIYSGRKEKNTCQSTSRARNTNYWKKQIEMGNSGQFIHAYVFVPAQLITEYNFSFNSISITEISYENCSDISMKLSQIKSKSACFIIPNITDLCVKDQVNDCLSDKCTNVIEQVRISDVSNINKELKVSSPKIGDYIKFFEKFESEIPVYPLPLAPFAVYCSSSLSHSELHDKAAKAHVTIQGHEFWKDFLKNLVIFWNVTLSEFYKQKDFRNISHFLSTYCAEMYKAMDTNESCEFDEAIFIHKSFLKDFLHLTGVPIKDKSGFEECILKVGNISEVTSKFVIDIIKRIYDKAEPYISNSGNIMVSLPPRKTKIIQGMFSNLRVGYNCIFAKVFKIKEKTVGITDVEKRLMHQYIKEAYSNVQDDLIKNSKEILSNEAQLNARINMLTFKTQKCDLGCNDYSKCCNFHDNTDLRRDPSICKYNSNMCKSGFNCPRGKGCKFSHNDYEAKYHPSSFRTQRCKEKNCSNNYCSAVHDDRPYEGIFTDMWKNCVVVGVDQTPKFISSVLMGMHKLGEKINKIKVLVLSDSELYMNTLQRWASESVQSYNSVAECSTVTSLKFCNGECNTDILFATPDQLENISSFNEDFYIVFSKLKLILLDDFCPQSNLLYADKLYNILQKVMEKTENPNNIAHVSVLRTYSPAASSMIGHFFKRLNIETVLHLPKDESYIVEEDDDKSKSQSNMLASTGTFELKVNPKNTVSDSANIDSKINILTYKTQKCMLNCSDHRSCLNFHDQSDMRRDPFLCKYTTDNCKSGVNCNRGRSCKYAHNEYEINYHPNKLRTEHCKDKNCKKIICPYIHVSHPHECVFTNHWKDCVVFGLNQTHEFIFSLLIGLSKQKMKLGKVKVLVLSTSESYMDSLQKWASKSVQSYDSVAKCSVLADLKVYKGECDCDILFSTPDQLEHYLRRNSLSIFSHIKFILLDDFSPHANPLHESKVFNILQNIVGAVSMPKGIGLAAVLRSYIPSAASMLVNFLHRLNIDAVISTQTNECTILKDLEKSTTDQFSMDAFKKSQVNSKTDPMEILSEASELNKKVNIFTFKTQKCTDYCGDHRGCFNFHDKSDMRRDPFVCKYSTDKCRSGVNCTRGRICKFAHNDYEISCHPSMFRMYMCKDDQCTSNICPHVHSNRPYESVFTNLWKNCVVSGMDQSPKFISSILMGMHKLDISMKKIKVLVLSSSELYINELQKWASTVLQNDNNVAKCSVIADLNIVDGHCDTDILFVTPDEFKDVSSFSSGFFRIFSDIKFILLDDFTPGTESQYVDKCFSVVRKILNGTVKPQNIGIAAILKSDSTHTATSLSNFFSMWNIEVFVFPTRGSPFKSISTKSSKLDMLDIKDKSPISKRRSDSVESGNKTRKKKRGAKKSEKSPSPSTQSSVSIKSSQPSSSTKHSVPIPSPKSEFPKPLMDISFNNMPTPSLGGKSNNGLLSDLVNFTNRRLLDNPFSSGNTKSLLGAPPAGLVNLNKRPLFDSVTSGNTNSLLGEPPIGLQMIEQSSSKRSRKDSSEINRRGTGIGRSGERNSSLDNDKKSYPWLDTNSVRNNSSEINRRGTGRGRSGERISSLDKKSLPWLDAISVRDNSSEINRRGKSVDHKSSLDNVKNSSPWLEAYSIRDSKKTMDNFKSRTTDSSPWQDNFSIRDTRQSMDNFKSKTTNSSPWNDAFSVRESRQSMDNFSNKSSYFSNSESFSHIQSEYDTIKPETFNKSKIFSNALSRDDSYNSQENFSGRQNNFMRSGEFNRDSLRGSGEYNRNSFTNSQNTYMRAGDWEREDMLKQKMRSLPLASSSQSFSERPFKEFEKFSEKPQIRSDYQSASSAGWRRGDGRKVDNTNMRSKYDTKNQELMSNQSAKYNTQYKHLMPKDSSVYDTQYNHLASNEKQMLETQYKHLLPNQQRRNDNSAGTTGNWNSLWNAFMGKNDGDSRPSTDRHSHGKKPYDNPREKNQTNSSGSSALNSAKGKPTDSSSSSGFNTAKGDYSIPGTLILLNNFSRNVLFLGNPLHNMILKTMEFGQSADKLLEFLRRNQNQKVLQDAIGKVNNCKDVSKTMKSTHNDLREKSAQLLRQLRNENKDSINLSAIAKATLGKDSTFVLEYIRNELRRIGDPNASKESKVNEIFLDVCSMHFGMSF